MTKLFTAGIFTNLILLLLSAIPSYIGIHGVAIALDALPSEMSQMQEDTPSVNILWDHGLSNEEIDKERKEIEQLTFQWMDALNAHNLSATTDLYDPSALLYATFKTRLSTPAQINDYFVQLFKRPQLRVDFDLQDLRIFAPNVAINSGIYKFTYVKDDVGTLVVTQARFTFVYLREAAGDVKGMWKIIDHHSSMDPEEHKKKESRKLDMIKNLAALYSEL